MPKGIYQRTEEIKLKMYKNIDGWWKGKKRPPFTEDHRRKLGDAHRGKKRKPFSRETLKKMSLAQKGKRLSEETKRKISLAQKGRKLSKDHTRKSLQRHIPTSLEIKFQEIAKKYSLPYKYVGNGSFTVGHYNPDFINTNGEKIAIEVYARYYKYRHTNNIEQWKKDRIKVFQLFGWRLIFFDEIELTEENVLLRL